MNKKPRVYLYYKGDTIGKDLPPLVEESAYERLETDNLNLFGMNQHHIKEIEELSAEIEKCEARIASLTNEVQSLKGELEDKECELNHPEYGAKYQIEKLREQSVKLSQFVLTHDWDKLLTHANALAEALESVTFYHAPEVYRDGEFKACTYKQGICSCTVEKDFKRVTEALAAFRKAFPPRD